MGDHVPTVVDFRDDAVRLPFPVGVGGAARPFCRARPQRKIGQKVTRAILAEPGDDDTRLIGFLPG